MKVRTLPILYMLLSATSLKPILFMENCCDMPGEAAYASNPHTQEDRVLKTNLG